MCLTFGSRRDKIELSVWGLEKGKRLEGDCGKGEGDKLEVWWWSDWLEIERSKGA